MERRTVADQLVHQGWWVLPRAFSGAACDTIRAVSARRTYPAVTAELVGWAGDAAWAPAVLDMLGPDVRLLREQPLGKAPHSSATVPWHQDQAQLTQVTQHPRAPGAPASPRVRFAAGRAPTRIGRRPEPAPGPPLGLFAGDPDQAGGAGHPDLGSGADQPSPPLFLTCLLALEAMGIDDGCLWVLPGSHRDGLLAHVGSAGLQRVAAHVAEDGHPVPLGKGDVLVLSPLLLHRSGPNAGPSERPTWLVQFCPAAAIDRWVGLAPERCPLVARRGNWLPGRRATPISTDAPDFPDSPDLPDSPDSPPG